MTVSWVTTIRHLQALAYFLGRETACLISHALALDVDAKIVVAVDVLICVCVCAKQHIASEKDCAL